MGYDSQRLLVHYETFVAFTQATYSAQLPRYVTDAFERYLVCGDFSQGFIRVPLRLVPARCPRALLVQATGCQVHFVSECALSFSGPAEPIENA